MQRAHTPFLFTACALLFLAACTDTRRHGEDDAGTGADAAETIDAPLSDTGIGTQAENTTALCSDGISNDDDAYVDCDDRDCCDVVSGCGASTFCGRTVTGSESSYSICSDSMDNDGDGYVDCDDRDCCVSRSDCGLPTYCGMHPALHDGESSASACGDSMDNDDDGHIDCDDIGCCASVLCPVGTDCSPSWCLEGHAEGFAIVLPNTTESGPTYADITIDPGAGGALTFELSGYNVHFQPRSAATPYTTTCVAVNGTGTDFDCSVTVTHQSWSTSGGDYTSGCGHVRGELRISNNPAGRFARYVFASSHPYTEEGAELVP